MVSTAVADDVAVVGDELNASGALDLGDVCRGETSAPGRLRFELQRRGDPNNNTWASGSAVRITGTAAPSAAGGLSLGSTSVTTPTEWATAASKGDNLDAGTASISVSVPAGADLGPAASVTTWSAQGARFGSGSLTKTDSVSVAWRVVACAPADSTPPSISYTLAPDLPDGDNGWYRQDVSIDWMVSDGESTATATGCADATFSTDGTHTSTCSASSSGGTTGPRSATVKRDATPPSVTPVVTGTLGEDDWYVGAVSVSWTTSDATSGLDTTTSCPATTLAEDTAARTFTCTARDLAGNQTVASITVKRDATDPVITSAVSGPLGQLGWYTGDVTVDWTVTDATSGVTATTGCARSSVVADTAGTTYTCSATDSAGNSDTRSVTVKRDATAPSITFGRTGTRGDNGWYTSTVGLTWNVSDSGSGLAGSAGCGPQTISADGRHSLTCTATDAAGNPASSTAQVNKDATAPAVEGNLSGATGLAGWFTGDVDVTWEVSEPTSGVASRGGCDNATVSADTSGARFTCTVTDLAGNEGSDSVTAKRDATAPAVRFTGGPEDGASYWFGDTVPTSTCEATDAMSGVEGCAVTGASTTVGAHTLTALASDNAGNPGSATRRYEVRAWTLDAFYRPVAMGSGVVNAVKAGSTVPLKFNVLRGSTPLTADIGATFTARKVGCDSSDVQDAIDEFSTTGGTQLRYDAAGGQWVQSWATPASGKGHCYRVTLTTADGSSRSADFRLK